MPLNIVILSVGFRDAVAGFSFEYSDFKTEKFKTNKNYNSRIVVILILREFFGRTPFDCTVFRLFSRGSEQVVHVVLPYSRTASTILTLPKALSSGELFSPRTLGKLEHTL